MEKRELLIKMVLTHEGYYVNIKADNGGETYCGIARKSHPNWEGWTIIDKYKPLRYNQKINDHDLNSAIISIYDKLYYKVMKIELISNMMLSAHVFCHGVNAGCSTAIKLLQKSINEIYKNASLTVDGKIGEKTLTYANDTHKIKELIDLYIIKRNEFYENIVKKNKTQEKFLKGWLSRVKGTTQTINNYYATIQSDNNQNIMVATDNNCVGQNILQKILQFIIKIIKK